MGKSDGAEPDVTQSKPLLGDSARRWIAGLLVIVGVQSWLILGQGNLALRWQLGLLAAAVVIAVIPPTSSLIFRMLDRIRNPSPRAMWIGTVGITIVSALFLVFTAWHQGRAFRLGWQDEGSYAIQIQMLAHGRLWMPAHPLADFFDSFQVIVDPVYASMYFPGASIFYVPAAWIGLPYWIISVLIAGASVGLVYWIMTDLIDGVAGGLGAMLMLGTSRFREISLLVAGHPAILLLGLLMVMSWLRWRKTGSRGWAIALGAFAGWAAITRPLDALIIALPIGIDLLLVLRQTELRKSVMSVGLMVASAGPFLALQIVFNIGVTGSWHRTPFEMYADRDYPDTTLGFHQFDPAHRPVSMLPQKQKFHDEWTIPAIQRHRPWRIIQNWLIGERGRDGDLQRTFADTLPHSLLTAFLPACVLALTTRKRIVVFLTFPLWIICYTFYTWLLPNYAMIIMPAVILMVLLGAHAMENAWPKLRRPIGTFLTLVILILSVTQTFELNRLVRDSTFDSSELSVIDQKLAKNVHAPAVVLFHFPPQANPHVEPVYNTQTPWPDDAPIIRANDLGPQRNAEIFRYYAQHQPDRTFYLYDRKDGSLTTLGRAKDLGHD